MTAIMRARFARRAGLVQRAFHRLDEGALLAQDEALVLRELEVGAALRGRP